MSCDTAYTPRFKGVKWQPQGDRHISGEEGEVVKLLCARAKGRIEESKRHFITASLDLLSLLFLSLKHRLPLHYFLLPFSTR